MALRTTRRAVLASAGASLAGLAGCVGGPRGEVTTASSTGTAGGDNPAAGDATQLGGLALTSPAFEDGGPIPRRYGAREENVNPPLEIANVPSGASSLVLVMDDPDARPVAGKVWDHWLVWNIDPGRTRIPEDWTPTTAVEGRTSGGAIGYGGPAPPDREHTYRFKCYGLDATLGVAEGATKDDLGAAMRDHVIARTQLEGTYAP